MSDLVWDKWMSFFTSLWYRDFSTARLSSSLLLILWFCLIGTLDCSYPDFSVSLRRSSIYFLWEIKILCLEQATSIPRKCMGKLLHIKLGCQFFPQNILFSLIITCNDHVIHIDQECEFAIMGVMLNEKGYDPVDIVCTLGISYLW